MNNSFRLIIAILIALFGAFTYFSNTQENPVTGEKQRVSLSPDQETALGLESAPQMAQQMGGLYQSAEVQAYVKSVGQHIVANSDAKNSPYKFNFHVLADPETVNAFALPGGQIFITQALLARLENEAQLAGVLGHEIGHVVGRHAAEHMAKARLTQTLAGAAGVAASDSSGGHRNMVIANMVSQVISLKYGRADENESDKFGIRFMVEAGYQPQAMIRVMEILEEASGGRQRAPEWLQSHPDPGNRRDVIKEEIARSFPNLDSKALRLDTSRFKAIQDALRS